MEKTMEVRYKRGSQSTNILGSRVKHIVLADNPKNSDIGYRNLVTSVKLEQGPAHDTLRIWNRGGLAGELRVTAGDGIMFVHRLFGSNVIEVLDEEE